MEEWVRLPPEVYLGAQVGTIQINLSLYHQLYRNKENIIFVNNKDIYYYFQAIYLKL